MALMENTYLHMKCPSTEDNDESDEKGDEDMLTAYHRGFAKPDFEEAREDTEYTGKPFWQ